MQKRDENGRIIRKIEKEKAIRSAIIEKCNPCSLHDKIECPVYAYPKAKWRLGDCPMATHVIARTKETDKFKRRVGQQKGGKK